MSLLQPRLTLAQIDEFDPQGPPHRKWCPLCGVDKPRDGAHRCLSVDRESGLWKCFRCDASGKAEEKWPQRTPQERHEWARQKLSDTFSLDSAPPPAPAPLNGDAVRADESAVVSPPKFDWRSAWESAAAVQGTAGELYLRRRAISRDAMRWADARFCAGWSGGASVVFPIHNRGGELVAAQGRAIRGEAKRTGGPKKEGAFFAPVELDGRIFHPLERRTPVIVLVEAPIDALSIASCGFPSLAFCGTSGPSWLHLACGLRRVALAFDADDAGERASDEVWARLSPFGAKCQRVAPQGFKDWNEWLQADADALTQWLDAHLF